MRDGIDELIRVHDEFYILASSPRVDDRTRVLKHGDSFAVLDRFGDMAPVGFGELGLYHEGTRFLSRLGLTLGRQRPLLLSSTVTADNSRLIVDLTNPDLPAGESAVVPRGTVHVGRETLLGEGVLYERIRVVNYGSSVVEVALHLRLDADYSDIFEVRGMLRERRGERMPAARQPQGLVFGYVGLDGVTRRTRIRCSQTPQFESDEELRFDLRLAEQEAWSLDLAVGCELNDRAGPVVAYEEALGRAGERLERARRRDCEITTSNETFDDWLRRSLADLHMMTTDTPQGPYPYAGTPWFSAPFGRDGVITALEMLWVNADIARGVLGFLAATQAEGYDDAKDAQPGKILHEARGGEMAGLGEVPFGRYYGSVDSTPLFVMLAAAYFRRTGDLEMVRSLWPHVERALGWLDHDGDPDHDGFIEYQRASPHGLVQQGWKDSYDSVFHADGTLVLDGPVALCEVQGYAYAARQGGAVLARALGLHPRAEALLAQAETLRERFEAAFWCEELSTYALALDGAKRPCRVRSSNAGHCLYTGIARPDRAARVAATLMEPDSFSGWGIRTLSMRERRFNPMSYHDGSVWPHDNALIAQGMSRYGILDGVTRVMSGLFDASVEVDVQRRPELFCGFPRRPGAGPTLYPVACAPQAWAAGAVCMLLAACLGIAIDAPARRVSLHRPVLPDFIDEIVVRRLCVGDTSTDLRFERHGRDVGVHVVRREGPLEVVMVM